VTGNELQLSYSKLSLG